MIDDPSNIHKFVVPSEDSLITINDNEGYNYVYDYHSNTENYYLQSGQYTLTKNADFKKGVTRNGTWPAELRKSIQRSKEQISSGEYNNQEIVKRAIERISLYPSIKKMLSFAVDNYFDSYSNNGHIDVRSLFNLLKYLPEIHSLHCEKTISIDSDLSLLTVSFYKENSTMHLVFDKNGEVIFNYSDNDMKKIRISGSSYFSGDISNAAQIKKLLNLV